MSDLPYVEFVPRSANIQPLFQFHIELYTREHYHTALAWLQHVLRTMEQVRIVYKLIYSIYRSLPTYPVKRAIVSRDAWNSGVRHDDLYDNTRTMGS